MFTGVFFIWQLQNVHFSTLYILMRLDVLSRTVPMPLPECLWFHFFLYIYLVVAPNMFRLASWTPAMIWDSMRGRDLHAGYIPLTDQPAAFQTHGLDSMAGRPYRSTVLTISHHCPHSIFLLETDVEFPSHSFHIEAQMQAQRETVVDHSRLLRYMYYKQNRAEWQLKNPMAVVEPTTAITVTVMSRDRYKKRCGRCQPVVPSLQKQCRKTVLRALLAPLWDNIGETTEHFRFEWLDMDPFGTCIVGAMMFNEQLRTVEQLLSFLEPKRVPANMCFHALLEVLTQRRDLLHEHVRLFRPAVSHRLMRIRSLSVLRLRSTTRRLHCNKRKVIDVLQDEFGVLDSQTI
jgi:hypothetical protein